MTDSGFTKSSETRAVHLHIIQNAVSSDLPETTESESPELEFGDLYSSVPSPTWTIMLKTTGPEQLAPRNDGPTYTLLGLQTLKRPLKAHSIAGWPFLSLFHREASSSSQAMTPMESRSSQLCHTKALFWDKSNHSKI